MHRKLVVLSFLVAASSACSKWKDGARFDHAVWALDGSHVDAVFETFEWKSNPWSLGNSNYERRFTTQVVSKSVDDSTPGSFSNSDYLGPVLEGRARRLYARPGYVLLRTDGERIPHKDRGEEERKQTWTRVNRDGSSKMLFEGQRLDQISCEEGSLGEPSVPDLALYPSPDGAYLAVVRGVPSCTSPTASLEVLSAASLAVVVARTEVPLHPQEGPYWDRLEVLWSADSQYVYTAQNVGAPTFENRGHRFSVAPGSAPEPVVVPDECVSPGDMGSSAVHAAHGYVTVEQEGAITISKSAGDPGCPL